MTDPFCEVLLNTPGGWRVFARPREWVEAWSVVEARALAERVEAWIAAGDWAAGAWAYEAAPAFDPALRTRPPQGPFPLAVMGRFGPPQPADPPAASPAPPLHWAPALARADYDAALASLRARIAAGETYQVNHTFPLHAAGVADARALFADLVLAHRPPYGAFLRGNGWAACCASPELFFELDGGRIRSAPMKGTRRRGRSAAEDQAQALDLAASEKDRAENVMITDMVRNDLGRICTPGSIAVPAPFVVEQHPTVWQMISVVEGRTRAGFTEVFRALFPAASITGAPKVRAMQIIAETEQTPRGLYTGAVGFWGPDRRAQFNVAIRTAVVDEAAGTAVYGVGGGITWGSVAAAEYDEALSKGPAVPLREAFELLETLRWTPHGGFARWPRHAARLAASARYFGFACDPERVRLALAAAARGFPPAPCRVRLCVDAAGGTRIASTPLDEPVPPPPWRLAFAPTPVASDDVFLRHKTTHRAVYTTRRAERPEADDVILHNERGEITETALANLVVELEGACWTPPAACGLLEGTVRAELLETGRVRERVLRAADVRRATHLWIANAVRGFRPAVLID
jgi:para-aminobenzoate synthetase / 4-amino-4-deoxychorismate lyase